jgi:DNA-binding response OmpR family regulator
MNLKSLLLSSDEKTIRILRRVLSDLEIVVDYCAHSETAIRKITRERFEAIIVDCADPEQAGQVLRGAKAAPVNKRALSIVLVESSLGLRGGFDMGAHFVLHKPLSNERAKSSFRAVRALMKRERRRQLRVPVQVPVLCTGVRSYHAKTLDLCEGGMAIQFAERIANEESLRFSLELPGIDQKLELRGEVAWEGQTKQAGVRFHDVTEQQQKILRKWLTSQLPEPEHDDPPVICQLAELSLGACYLRTSSPFPKGTRIVLGLQIADVDVRAGGIVRVAHPEFGMGVEFLQATQNQQEQVRQIIDALRSHGQESLQLQVEPDALEITPSEASPTPLPSTDDPLVDLFRRKSQVAVEVFLQEMQQHRRSLATS